MSFQSQDFKELAFHEMSQFPQFPNQIDFNFLSCPKEGQRREAEERRKEGRQVGREGGKEVGREKK
jgi:hypothetical protein